MTKQELVARIEKDINMSGKTVDAVLTNLGFQIQEALENDAEITLPGVGKFSVTRRAARTGRNPATGEEIQIPAKRVPAFKAAKALKDAVA